MKHRKPTKYCKADHRKGGVQPLSRMHPEHPARAMYGYPRYYIPECKSKQEFVP